MKHSASPEFWAEYHQLPVETRKLADESYQRLKSNPGHPSLHLKRVRGYWSVRVGLHYRALGVSAEPETIVWFWIGTHAAYDRLVRN